MTKTFRIAAIAGDGIGQEVMPEGLRVLRAAARRFGIDLQFETIASEGAVVAYVLEGRGVAMFLVGPPNSPEAPSEEVETMITSVTRTGASG